MVVVVRRCYCDVALVGQVASTVGEVVEDSKV